MNKNIINAIIVKQTDKKLSPPQTFLKMSVSQPVFVIWLKYTLEKGKSPIYHNSINR